MYNNQNVLRLLQDLTLYCFPNKKESIKSHERLMLRMEKEVNLDIRPKTLYNNNKLRKFQRFQEILI